MSWGVPTPIVHQPQVAEPDDRIEALELAVFNLKRRMDGLSERLYKAERVTLGSLIRAWWKSLWQ